MKITMCKKKRIYYRRQDCCKCKQNEQHPELQMLSNLPKLNKKSPNQQLIQIESQTVLTSVNKNSYEVEKLIVSTMRRHMIEYTRGLGYLCAHVALQYPFWSRTYSQIHEQTIYKLLKKYSFLIYADRFQEKNRQQKYLHLTMLERTEILEYVLKCLKFNATKEYEDFQILVTNISFKENFLGLIDRYARSLLLEFIPSQLSECVLNIYLEENRVSDKRYQEQSKNMIEKNEHVNNFKYKFQKIYRLIISVIHYIVYFKKPLNFNHFFELANNCYAGSVEWPIIIGNMQKFQLPQ